MRRKEIAEIRKQFSLEKCNITRIDTSLITQGEITTRQQQTFLNMDDDDILKYLGIFKKTLSGKLGKNLLNLKFRTPEPEMSWGFLQQIRDSGLKDEDLIVLATESIKKNLNLENNWYIIWVRGVYDVPRRAKDGAELEDSEDVYDYIMCCICPMKLTKAALGYNEEKDQVNSRYVNVVENCLHLWKPIGHELNELVETKTEEKPGWIPVTERLPEEHDSIFAKFKGTEKWKNDFLRASSDAKITAWMPFPEPYKE